MRVGSGWLVGVASEGGRVTGGIVNEIGEEVPSRAAVSVEAIGQLIAYLDMNGLQRRRPQAVQRLRGLRDSEAFSTLPDDLRARIRELVDEAE